MGSKILFVDDAKSVRDAFVLAHGDELDIIVAPGGDEALALLSLEKSVAVIVTDYKMPKMNGIDLARIIRFKFPHKRIILHSANSSISLIKERANDIHIDAFINKVDPDPGAIQRARSAIQASIQEYKNNGK